VGKKKKKPAKKAREKKPAKKAREKINDDIFDCRAGLLAVG
jgi:hypothetical protein